MVEDQNEQLVIASYQWEYPIWGLSRHEFCKGLHPAFTGHYHAWCHTVGIYRENGKVVACVINEGHYNGEAFFLFDSRERGEDRDLLGEMIKLLQTVIQFQTFTFQILIAYLLVTAEMIMLVNMENRLSMIYER